MNSAVDKNMNHFKVGSVIENLGKMDLSTARFPIERLNSDSISEIEGIGRLFRLSIFR
jgi:hypothetical protein